MGMEKEDHFYMTYDFGIVTAAASVVFTYVVIVPLLLYGFLWYRKSDVGYSYLEILSTYGYSLTIFVPVSVLWVINFDIVRWILILVAVFLSGTVLVFTFWPAVKADQNKLFSFLAIILIVGLHVLLAIGFKHYFFNAVHSVGSTSGGKGDSQPLNGQTPPTEPPKLPQSLSGSQDKKEKISSGPVPDSGKSKKASGQVNSNTAGNVKKGVDEGTKTKSDSASGKKEKPPEEMKKTKEAQAGELSKEESKPLPPSGAQPDSIKPGTQGNAESQKKTENAKRDISAKEKKNSESKEKQKADTKATGTISVTSVNPNSKKSRKRRAG